LNSLTMSPPGLTLSLGPGAVVQVPPVSFANSLTPEIEALALRGIDFPLPPTAPGFVYSYNASTGIFERSASLGPAFTERAQTVGKGRFEVGGSFLYGNLDSVDGGGFGDSGSLLPATLQGENVLLGQLNRIKSFSLQSFNFNLTATYGLTERWD